MNPALWFLLGAGSVWLLAQNGIGFTVDVRARRTAPLDGHNADVRGQGVGAYDPSGIVGAYPVDPGLAPTVQYEGDAGSGVPGGGLGYGSRLDNGYATAYGAQSMTANQQGAALCVGDCGKV